MLVTMSDKKLNRVNVIQAVVKNGSDGVMQPLNRN